MASLRKPHICSNCDGNSFTKHQKPERWVCDVCNYVEVSRPMRNDPDVCRSCGCDRDGNNFKKRQNVCKNCANDEHKIWRHNNPEYMGINCRRWRQSLPDGEATQRVKKSIERSAEAFCKHLGQTVRKSSNWRKDKRSRVIEVDIDGKFVFELYNKQDGKCAITGLTMVHKRSSPYSISVDRIDSSGGYTKDNVQLVCQSVNYAKNLFTQDDMIKFFDDYFDGRLAAIDAIK